MSSYVEGMDRRQALVLPEVLDDYVDQENEVRFIDAFIDTLDLVQLGFTHSEPKDEGRPAYDPRDMLKLYVWGYLNRVRSSRKLERECHRNLEVMWMMRKLTPDFWTIAEFRKQNVDRIKSVFREFVSFLQEIDLIEGKLASIDGSKFEASNATKRNFDAKRLALKLKRIEESVERYMNELRENDELGMTDTKAQDERELIKRRSEHLVERLEKLRAKKKELEEIKKELKESGQSQISLTDEESRLMKCNGKFDVAYNTELSVDSKEKLIVDYNVTNEGNDQNQLAPMAKETKEVLGVEKLDVTADSGFANMNQIKECIDNGITPYLPSSNLDGGSGTGGSVPDPVAFGKDKFLYDGRRDVYICPAGNELAFMYVEANPRGRNVRRYGTDACGTCPFRARCTTSKKGRTIQRWEHQEIIDELVERAKREPEKLEARAKLSEHPFGTIKRAFNMGYFLLKGLKKVNGEMGFTVLAYDMRRALNILGTKGLLRALMEFAGGTGRVISVTK